MPRQFGVVVPMIVGDLLAKPVRPVEVLIGPLKFDLNDHQALIGAEENIDLPDEAAIRDIVANFFDNFSLAQCEEGLRVPGWDGIFELAARKPRLGALDGQHCPVLVDETNANG